MSGRPPRDRVTPQWPTRWCSTSPYPTNSSRGRRQEQRSRGGRRPGHHARHRRGQAAATDRHPQPVRLRPPGAADRWPPWCPAPSGTASRSSAPTSSTPSTCHDAALGAVAFVGPVAQLLWAVPLALWADRGSRKVVAGGRAAHLLRVRPADGPVPQRLGRSPSSTSSPRSGTGVNNTVHNSYLSDAYPTEGRGRIFSWHNLSDPLSQTVGILIFGLRRDRRRTTGGGACSSPWSGSPSGCRPVHPARAGEGCRTSPATS